MTAEESNQLRREYMLKLCRQRLEWSEKKKRDPAWLNDPIALEALNKYITGLKEDMKKYDEPKTVQSGNIDGITWRSGA
jgi:hypothetical protein